MNQALFLEILCTLIALKCNFNVIIEMLVKKAFKFRLYPNKEQSTLLNKTFGCTRFLWNQMLSERKKVYNALKDDKEALHRHEYKTEKE